MKRTFIFLTLWVAASAFVMAGENTPAVLTKTDGNSWKVFLMSTDGTFVETEFQKLRQKKSFTVDEIKGLKFTPPGENENELKALDNSAQILFQQADYVQLIDQVEPIVASYGKYMSISNNLQTMYGLLMQSYSRSGQHPQAAAVAKNLMGTQDQLLKLNATVCAALAAADQKEFTAAETFLTQISDPVASLYVQASIQRAQGAFRDAIQTSVKVIADHVDNMDWLPRTEFLCAELYLETGRTNSAVVTARQAAKFYAGTNVGNEADALHSRIEQLMNKSE